MSDLITGFSNLTLALTALAAGVAGLARGFSGFGGALIFMPVASALVTPAVAAPILLIADGVLALGFLPNAWVLARRKDVGLMAMGALIGVPLGTLILNRADPLPLRWAISVTAISMLALLLSGWRYNGKPTPAITVIVGAISGIFGGLAQMSGPPVVAYWLTAREKHDAMRASIILFFGATTMFTFINYLAWGLITRQTVLFAAIVAPAYGLGLFVGAQAFHFASPEAFRRLCFILIALSVAVSLPLWR